LVEEVWGVGGGIMAEPELSSKEPSLRKLCVDLWLWRNCRWGRNSQYLTHEEVKKWFPKLWQILLKWKESFDDVSGYKLTNKYVVRFPVEDKPRSGSFWEDKDKRKDDIFQTILEVGERKC
jgi:hypothetical protein